MYLPTSYGGEIFSHCCDYSNSSGERSFPE